MAVVLLAKTKTIQDEYDNKMRAIENEHAATIDMIHNEYVKQLTELEAEISKLRGRNLSYKHLCQCII